MHPLFGRAMEYDGGEYGEGILSRFSFLETKNNPLPHSSRHEPRAPLEVLLELTSGDEIIFIGTHFDHTRDQTDRIAQARRINKLFKKTKKPTILAGDLNATPESEPMKILSRFWTDASARDPQPTFPSSNPRRRIDYVLFRPADRWKVLETRVIDEKVASDHCPLLVVLELLPEKKNKR
jgi:endonuclease/exonuclease/phosphatase family metal-dependent hydrolase